MIDRRVFIGGLASGVVGISRSSEAQQAGKVPRIGYLSQRSGAADGDRVFLQGLRALGYSEGHNIAIEYRWAAGATDRLSQFAKELVQLKVDVIVAVNGPAVQAAKRATSTIPIVMAGVADPVASGFVDTLARPGGNITGVSLMYPDVAGKSLELLRELIPMLSRVGFLAQAGSAYRRQVQAAQKAAEELGMRVEPLVIVDDPGEVAGAFSAMVRGRAEAVLVQPILVAHARRITELAERHRLPTVSSNTGFAYAGGLMAYGPNPVALLPLVAVYVDRILKGAKPGDLPVEQPAKLDLLINIRTAKALGLTIPQSLLLRADEVIE